MIQIPIEPFFYDESKILEAQHLTFPKNRWSCILGSSGIGKTTLLKHIAGLHPGQTQRPSCLYLGHQNTLLPWLRVFDNAVISAKLRGDFVDIQKARAHLSAFGLGDVLDSYPHQLSQGMKRRAVFARILMEPADLILLDEPFSGLDAHTTQEVRSYATRILQGKTVICVTHDVMDALSYHDAFFYLKGRPALLHTFNPSQIARNHDLTNILREIYA